MSLHLHPHVLQCLHACPNTYLYACLWTGRYACLSTCLQECDRLGDTSILLLSLTRFQVEAIPRRDDTYYLLSECSRAYDSTDGNSIRTLLTMWEVTVCFNASTHGASVMRCDKFIASQCYKWCTQYTLAIEADVCAL